MSLKKAFLLLACAGILGKAAAQTPDPLTFTRADSWEHAIALANDSDYGLTASFYSRDPAKIAAARQRLHVGNLYINRKCTGALSGTHAFGGYGMSGTNAKVGGPDYLFWFLQTKTVAQRY